MIKKVEPFDLAVLWASEMRTEEIAREIGWSRSKLDTTARLLKLGKRPHVRNDLRLGSKAPDPSPSEIEERCAEIRAGWSELETMSRKVGYARVRYGA
jgi:hypothetical protein